MVPEINSDDDFNEFDDTQQVSSETCQGETDRLEDTEPESAFLPQTHKAEEEEEANVADDVKAGPSHSCPQQRLVWRSSSEMSDSLESISEDFDERDSSPSSSLPSSSLVASSAANIIADHTRRTLRYSLWETGRSELTCPTFGTNIWFSAHTSEESLSNEEAEASTPVGSCSSPKPFFKLFLKYTLSQIHREGRLTFSEVVLRRFRSPNTKNPLCPSADTRVIRSTVELIFRKLNSGVDNLLENGWPWTSISVQKRLIAVDLLKGTTLLLESHSVGQMELTRLTGRSHYQIERRLDNVLGPLAAQILLGTLSSIHRAETLVHGPVPSGYMHFMAGLGCEIKAIVAERSGIWKPTRPSGSDHLLHLSPAKISRDVNTKIMEIYSHLVKDLSLSEDGELILHRFTASVDTVVDDTQNATEYLEIQASSSHQSTRHHTRTEDLNMDVMVMDVLTSDLAPKTFLDDMGPRSERLSPQGPSTHGSCNPYASIDLVEESELCAQPCDDTCPARCCSKVKKKSQSWWFPRLLKRTRIKVFNNRVDTEIHSAKQELPLQCSSTSEVALTNSRIELFRSFPLSPKPDSDLPPEPAAPLVPAEPPEQTRKRPWLVRAFQGICRTMSKSFTSICFWE